MNVLRPLLLLAAALPPTLNAQEKPRKSPQPMLLPQAVVVPRGERELQIDGSLIDWPELPAMVLSDRRQLSGTAHDAWRGPADTSAFAFMMWDQQSLYVACAVRDEWHRALDPKTMMLTEVPAADSVVLTFDPERNTRSNGPDPGRREDREFWLADEASREVVRWDRLRGSAEMLEAPARMVALIGPARTKMILAAGQKIEAEEACAWGLVDRIVEPDALVESARALLSDALAAKPETARGILEMCR